MNSDEYEKLAKRMTDIDASIGKLASKVMHCEDDIAYLSGKINKRLAAIPRHEEEEKPPETAPGLVPIGKDLNSRLGI